MQEPEFVELNDRIDGLLADPETRRDVTAIRDQAEAEERLYIEGVDALRQASRLTQEQLTGQLAARGGPAATVSSQDVLLSALQANVERLGFDVELVITLKSGDKTHVDLDHFAAWKYGGDAGTP